MRRALIHGFAGDPSVWDAVDVDDSFAIALPMPPRSSWQANLDAIDLRGAEIVVGYSLGARVALGLLAQQRCKRAILISVNPGIDDAERPIRRATDVRWAEILRRDGITAFVDAWEAQPLFATQVRADRATLAARRARRLAMNPEHLARSLETMGLAEMPDLRGSIDELPCELIAGADDAKFIAIARATKLPLTVIPDCGHDPTLERPSFLATLLAELLHTNG